MEEKKDLLETRWKAYKKICESLFVFCDTLQDLYPHQKDTAQWNKARVIRLIQHYSNLKKSHEELINKAAKLAEENVRLKRKLIYYEDYRKRKQKEN